MKKILMVLVALFLLSAFDAAGADTLKIPDGTKTIEEEAFWGDTGLDEVVFPEGSLSIGRRAFADTSVRLVHFPATMNEIDDTAFQGTQMTGTGLSLIYAQQWCLEHGFQYQVSSTPVSSFQWEAINNTEARITAYTGSDRDVIIPDTIEGKRITDIDSDAFMKNSVISSVVLPYYLEEIHSTQFYYCPNLQRITIRGNVKIIGQSAFSKCYKLSEVLFLDEPMLNTVSCYAFENCYQLQSIILPDTVTTIGPAAFKNCASISDFHFPVSWTELENVSTGVRYGSIFAGCSNLKRIEIPEGVQIIPDYAFGNDPFLEEVIFPESLKIIGAGAFYNNTAIESVTFNAGLEEIKHDAFNGCVSLANLNGLASSHLTSIGYSSFERCQSLTDISLPNSLEMIGQASFRYCEALSSFHYPTGWKYVSNEVISDVKGGGSIFYGCPNLTTIHVPEGVTAIPSSAFACCNYLQDVILPESLEEIGKSAFYNAEAIRQISLPSGVCWIGESAFEGCTALQHVYGLSDCAITEIAYSTFENCSSLIAAELPDAVTAIGPSAFLNCTSLKSFHYPVSWSTVTKVVIGGVPYSSIFRGCNLLTEIEVPYGVTAIPDYAFCNSDCLKTVYLPDSVIKIGKSAFFAAESMDNIYLSEFISEIRDSAFEGCENLTVFCEWATYALSYVQEHDIPYYYLSLTDSYRLIHDSPAARKMYQGDSYSLFGYVRSSLPVDQIQVIVRDASNSTVINETISPASTDVLLRDAFNDIIRFETLETGHYRLTLDAWSGGTTERLSNVSFSIVPPPLRVNAQNLDVPQGVTNPTLRIGGMLSANYTIQRIEAAIWNESGTLCKMKAAAEPNTASFDLSRLADDLSLAELPFAAYLFTIDVYTTGGNCQEYIRNTFIPTQNNSHYSDEELEAILSFALVPNNKHIFDFAAGYANDYFYQEFAQTDTLEIGPIKFDFSVDAFVIAFNDYKDIAWGKINETMYGRDSYLVDMYKGQIMAVLKEMRGREIATTIDKNNFVLQVMDWIASSGNAELKLDQLGIVDNEILKAGASLIKPFEKLFSAVKQAKPSVELANQLNQGIAYSLSENLYEISIIQAVKNSLAEGTDVNSKTFKQALEEVYGEYACEGYGVIMPIINQAIELAKGENIKNILKLVGKDCGAAYSVANFAIKAYNKVSGLSDLAKSRKDFIKIFDNACYASRAYGNAFEAVQDGDTSAEALNRIYITYCYARSSWRAMMDYLKTNWLPDTAVYFDADHAKIKNMKFPGVE